MHRVLAWATTTACPGPYLLYMEALLRTMIALAVTVDTLQHLVNTMQLSMFWTLVGWADETLYSTRSRDSTCPCTWHPIPLDRWSQHAPACTTTGGGLFLVRSVYDVWKWWLLLQMCRHLHRLQVQWRIRETWHHLGNTVNSSNESQGNGLHE